MQTERLLRYFRLWLHPPSFEHVDIVESEGETIDFVKPVFVLSTGRCGTAWLSELLRHDPKMRVNHSDYPQLIRHSRLAYEQYEEDSRLFEEVVRATRDGYILDAHKRDVQYIETNNRITFFAHALKTVYPQARFLHIVRHPGDFVRSGLRRGWYQGHTHDVGRIWDFQHPAVWQQLSKIERIAWLWNETNEYIESFLRSIDPDDYHQVRAEDMFSCASVAQEVLSFIGARIGSRTIRVAQARPVNEQRLGNVPIYTRWTVGMKEQMRQEAVLAAGYGYDV